MTKLECGYPKLGASVLEYGINFGIYATNVQSIRLKIYEKAFDIVPIKTILLDPLRNKTGNVWHVFIEGCKENTIYLWEINSINILDPYCKSFTKAQEIKYKKNIAIKHNEFEIKDRPNIPWNQTIIYEAHIGLFTKNSNSRVLTPGTFSGFKEKIPYLKELGITAVEFLPIYEWDDFTGRYDSKNQLLKNIWGYNPVNFFALTRKYSSDKNPDLPVEITEFKELVSELHKNGIEVILDVVYNHTAEGGIGGPNYNFKIMSNSKFYILGDNCNYSNYSGCGNTFNCNTKVSKDMIIDSLKYWFLEIGVDGFRFDLAPILGRDCYGQWGSFSLLNEISEDPILSHCKLISESWDLGGYYVGDMPEGWSEWNGKFRDVVRKFVKGEFGQVPELLKRIFGSSDIFGKKGLYSTINFISCHDGFTLNDLVSYNTKHNLDNGENNRDGENNNNSYNWGEEGISQNPNIIKLRSQQIKNFLLILFISQGVPMLLMGDEICRTQHGNNNAYCQDNETTWFDWELVEKNKNILEFTKEMIKLRKTYNIFQDKDYWHEDLSYTKEIAVHGVKLHSPDFSYHSLSIAFELYDKDSDHNFYIALNSYYNSLNFELPKLNNKKWYPLVDTSLDDSFVDSEIPIKESQINVQPRSSIILISK